VDLSVLGELARRPRIERATQSRNPRRYDRARQPPKDPAAAVADWVQIDLPDEDSDRWRFLGPVPLGKPSLIQALPDLEDAHRVRAIVALVTEVKP
jgi:hypothetical protein